MAIISFYLNGEDEKLIKNYAKSKNMSVSSFLRSIAVERIEDDIDDQLYEKAQREPNNLNCDVSLADLRRELSTYCWYNVVRLIGFFCDYIKAFKKVFRLSRNTFLFIIRQIQERNNGFRTLVKFRFDPNSMTEFVDHLFGEI